MLLKRAVSVRRYRPLSTQNKCLNWPIRKYSQIYPEIFYLFGSMEYTAWFHKIGSILEVLNPSCRSTPVAEWIGYFPPDTLLSLVYSNCSKISNTFLFPYSNKMLVFRAEIHRMLVRIANRADPDQTASSEAVWSGSVLFVEALLTGN